MTSPYAHRLSKISIKHQQVTVLGSETSYWVYGSPEANKTVLAVHGFRGDHHGLEPVVAFLPQYRFIIPDLPGFGQSTPLPNRVHNLEAYADWLTAFSAAVIDDSELMNTTILGHSFGSLVVGAAIADGLSLPQTILINPISAPALSGPRSVLTRLAILYYLMGERLPERLGTALLRNPVIVRVMSIAMAKTKNRNLRRFIHQQHDSYFSLFAHRRLLREAFEASVGHHLAEFAPSFNTPTLLIVADRDDITPISAQHHLNDKIADSRLVTLTSVGHLIHYESPAEAASAIDEFLSADDAATPTGPQP